MSHPLPIEFPQRKSMSKCAPTHLFIADFQEKPFETLYQVKCHGQVSVKALLLFIITENMTHHGNWKALSGLTPRINKLLECFSNFWNRKCVPLEFFLQPT